MKCLLIGGLGYLGGPLAQNLKAQGHEITLTTRRPQSAIPSWANALGPVISVDPSKPNAFASLLRDHPIVIHLAGPDEIEAAKDPDAAKRATQESLHYLLETLSQPPTRAPLIYLSTFHVYGQPQGLIREDTPPKPVYPYAVAKLAGENLVGDFGIKNKASVVRVRVSNAFGAPVALEIPRWTLVFNDLCRQAVEKKQLTLKSAGLQQRNFVTLTDVSRALEFLARRVTEWPADGILHLGSSLQWSIRDVAEKVAARAQALFGFTPSLIAPAAAGDTAPPTFEFSQERLRGLGFTWTNDWQSEVDNTLRLCQARSRV
jgi:UDP-glucose 4-epimerase